MRVDLESIVSVEPSIVEILVDFSDAAPVLGVHCEHLLKEGEKFGGEFLPGTRRLVGSSALPLDEFVVVSVTECGLFPGKAASQHTEEEDAH